MRTPTTLIAVGLSEHRKLPPREEYTPSTPYAPAMGTPTTTSLLEDQSGAKASRDEAGFIEAARSCGNCSYWDNQTGDCQKVEGTMDCNDRCETFFSPVARSGQTATPAHVESTELPVGGDHVA